MTLLLAALLAVVGLQGPQANTGILEGTVIQLGSTRPVEGARVAIWGDKGPDFTTTTNGNGRYVLNAIPPGVFNLEITADGFLSLPNPSTNESIRLTVRPGQRMRYDASLLTFGVISGRILNDNREPLAGVKVEVLQLQLDSMGRPTWQSVADTVTNDDGVYRAGDLPSDDYYVRASKQPSSGSATRGASVDLAATYFPGTTDARHRPVLRESSSRSRAKS